MKIKPKDINRFWSYVDKDGPIVREELGPCWLWKSFLSSNGYALFNLNGHQIVAHRVGYFIHTGVEIPRHLSGCHKCDNKICIRGEHIFPGTARENMQDAVKKGRIATGRRTGAYTHPEMKRYGDKHGMAKVTEVQALEIIQAYAQSPIANKKRRFGKIKRELAGQYGLSETQIESIAYGRDWRHLPRPYATCKSHN